MRCQTHPTEGLSWPSPLGEKKKNSQAQNMCDRYSELMDPTSPSFPDALSNSTVETEKDKIFFPSPCVNQRKLRSLPPRLGFPAPGCYNLCRELQGV